MKIIEVEAALELILEQARAPRTESSTFGTALMRVLAEDVISDIDSPPFDKSMMDGFAVHAQDIQAAETELTLIGTITAGQVPAGELQRGKAIRIMTGAMLPSGADAVVAREQTNDPPADSNSLSVVIRTGPIQPGANVLKQGTCISKGQTVLTRGTSLRACQFGLLAEQGHHTIQVYAQPTAVVLATGNELVPVDRIPDPGKIRNTNGPMLTGLLRTAGCNVMNLGVVGDDAGGIERLVRQSFQVDIAIFTGGVSAGDLDLLPGIFQKLKIVEIFHGVNLKPGKPVWFGRAESGTLVFGLPGNPVSSYVCTQLLVRPAIAKMAGSTQPYVPAKTGRLTQTHEIRGDRRTYWPGMFQRPTEVSDGAPAGIELLPWKGSADLMSWRTANCLVDLAAAQTHHEGSLVRYLELI